MTDIAALADLPAARIARAFAAGTAGPAALTEHLLARIAGQPSPVFLTVTAARARAEAAAAEARIAAGRPLSPLDGVPIAWKDLVDMAGERTTAGSALMREAPRAAADAPVVANAARAGMVSLGKLNLAEFAYSALGQNPHFGTPLNPRSAAPRAPGGSSSGSGAAVAGGLAPCALGSDTGGSVRIPASFCGIVGFKTSAGRIPIAGAFPLSRTQDTLGPLARSVEDCALLDAVLRGAPGAQAPRPLPPDALRLFVPEGVALDDLAPAVAAAFEATLRRLAAAGARLRRAPLPAFDRYAAAMQAGTLIAAEAFHEHRAIMDGPDAARLDPRVRARIEIGRSMSAADLLDLQRMRAHGIAEIAAALDGALLVMPTTAITAPPLADFDGDADHDAAFRRLNLAANRNTNLGAFHDMPGLAIPNGTGPDGLPVSFLLSAPGGEDERLLRAGLGAEALIRGHDR